MTEVIQVRLREAGKIFYYNARGIKFSVGDAVVVEADRGIDYGYVLSEPAVMDDKKFEEPVKAVIRKVDQKDQDKIDSIKAKAKEAHSLCVDKINEHGLPMKLVESEYSFDISKLIFYFTSEGRVDFRKLVKDLAAVFKVRIELRQIGVRDEAKMLGGYGHCGRPLCCSSYIKDFDPVTIKMAKEQRLSLNPTKISGACGRLMCCLVYESDTYNQLSARLPEEGDKIKIPDGAGKVVKVDILRQKVKVELDSGAIKDLSFAGCSCPKSGCEVHKKYTILKNKKKKTKKEMNEEDEEHDFSE